MEFELHYTLHHLPIYSLATALSIKFELSILICLRL